MRVPWREFGRGAISSLTGLLASAGKKENEKEGKKGRINLSKVSTNLSFPLQRSFFILIILKEKRKKKSKSRFVSTSFDPRVSFSLSLSYFIFQKGSKRDKQKLKLIPIAAGERNRVESAIKLLAPNEATAIELYPIPSSRVIGENRPNSGLDSTRSLNRINPFR